MTIVISLNGGNDLWLGQGSDPNLLVRDQITYQYEHTEPWSRLLHDSAERTGSQPDVARELKVLNQLAPVLRAYVARMRQFRDMVVGAGSQFVWALQPTMHSKPDWSPLEKENLENWDVRENAVRANMARLYGLLDGERPRPTAPGSSVWTRRSPNTAPGRHCSGTTYTRHRMVTRQSRSTSLAIYSTAYLMSQAWRIVNGNQRTRPASTGSDPWPDM